MEKLTTNKDKWDLTHIFENEKEFETALDEVKKEIESILEYKGKLNNAKSILSLKKFLNKLALKIEKIGAYSFLNYAQDMSEELNVARYKRVEDLQNYISKITHFIEPELSKLTKKDIDKMFSEEKELLKYKKEFEELLEDKKHILPLKQEEILSMLGSTFSGYSTIYEIFTNTEITFNKIKDSKGKEHELTQSNFSKYLASLDGILRRNAFLEIYNQYEKYKNTISEIYLRDVKTESTLVLKRKYNSSLECALKGDESSIKTYRALKLAVLENLPINHKWLKVKKEVLKKYLNVEKPHMYDMYVNPFNELNEEKIPYEKAQEIVLEGLKPLGKEYIDTLKKAFNENWIDVYPKPGKQDGAFSLGVYGVHPYVLLNYIGLRNDVSTIAHELGHSMHSYMADSTQEIYNAGYTILIAEVASTVNEILLANYLITNTKDEELKKKILWEHIDGLRATLLRQTMFAEFEEYVHNKIDKGVPLTEKDLSENYFELVNKYFGEDIIIDEQIRYEWERIPHFYSSFYVYKYATGVSAAIYIAKNILERGKEYREKYFEMLKTGGKIKSLDILKIAEVDLEDRRTYNQAFEYLEDKINEFEKLEES